ncbi:discoidin domain-containing protein [Candidatus Poribacteria bacterium]|nr:discoidin domain-containing protein [Candidatus Poribacteria bacterium]
MVPLFLQNTTSNSRKSEFSRRLNRMKSMLVLAGLVLMIAYLVISTSDMAQASKILGVGTGSLIGGDLTDPENDGDPEQDKGYNAKFSANDEPGFGGGEFAFNVFDNRLGPSNDKWCCGLGGGIPKEGLWVTAELEKPYLLTHFTVSSANDVPGRDPTDWEVQGSNDGIKFTTIFSQKGKSLWGDTRLQVIRFDAGTDFEVQRTGYKFFRQVTFNTATNPAGAYFQIGEIEYFGKQGVGTAVDPQAKLATTWGSLKHNR